MLSQPETCVLDLCIFVCTETRAVMFQYFGSIPSVHPTALNPPSLSLQLVFFLLLCVVFIISLQPA